MTVAVLAACGESPQPLADPTIRLQDGVRVVENRTLLADSVSWTFDTLPEVTIGVADGPEEYIIGRLAGFARRPDGTFIIGDGISETIRHYAADGSFIARYGGSGDGPGEFRVLRTVAVHHRDSLLVVDYEGGRGTILDQNFKYVRTFRIRLQDGKGESVFTSDGMADIAGEGHLLMYDYLNVCGGGLRSGFCEDSMSLFRTDLTGAPVAALGRFVYMRGETRSVPPGRSFGWGEPHPQVFRRTKGSRTYYADATRFEILVFDGAGKLELIVRAPHTKYQLGKDDVLMRPVSANQTSDTASAALSRQMAEAQSASAIPDSLPQFSDMLVDDEGRIWVGEYLPAGRPMPRMPRWYVFTSEGILSHIVKAPRELRSYPAPWLRAYPQVGNDFAVTAKRDSDGVEYVVMYRLRKQ